MESATSYGTQLPSDDIVYSSGRKLTTGLRTAANHLATYLREHSGFLHAYSLSVRIRAGGFDCQKHWSSSPLRRAAVT